MAPTVCHFRQMNCSSESKDPKLAAGAYCLQADPGCGLWLLHTSYESRRQRGELTDWSQIQQLGT